MQLTMYNWNLVEKNNNIRQGVVTAKNQKEAKQYLIASMNKDEQDLFSNNAVKFTLSAIYTYTGPI
jgi:hypothetical protein